MKIGGDSTPSCGSLAVSMLLFSPWLSFFRSFLQQAFIEPLSCGKNCSRGWGYRCEHGGQGPACLRGTILPVREGQGRAERASGGREGILERNQHLEDNKRGRWDAEGWDEMFLELIHSVALLLNPRHTDERWMI